MTREEFAQVLAYVEGCWPRQPLADPTAAVWWAELRHLDAETVQAAVRAIYRSGRDFQPTAGHVLGEIAEQTEDAPSFGEAWAQILTAIRRHGSRNPQRVIDSLDHPAVATLAAEIDIRDLGMAAESALTTWHAQSRERYRSIVARRSRTITHAGLPAATAPGLRGASERIPRPASGAIGELVASLEPHQQEGAA